MVLNYECVRDVLLYLESVPYVITDESGDVAYTGVWFRSICEALPKYTSNTLYYALTNLEQAEYLDVSEQWGSDVLAACVVNYITYAGHEFLEKIRADTTWSKTLAVAGKVGNFGLNMLAKISEGIATAYINTLIT